MSPARRAPAADNGHPATPAPTDRPDPASRGLFRLSEIRSRSLTWLWPGRIPFGKLTILDGDPGLGKSTLLLDLAARLTTARPLPDDPTLPLEPPPRQQDPQPPLR